MHACIATVGYSAYVLDIVAKAAQDVYGDRPRVSENGPIVCFVLWIAVGTVLWYWMDTERTAIQALHATIGSLAASGLQVGSNDNSRQKLVS